MKSIIFFVLFCVVTAQYVSASGNDFNKSRPPSADEKSEHIRLLFKEVGASDLQKLKYIRNCVNAYDEAERTGKEISITVHSPKFSIAEVVRDHPQLGKVPIDQIEVVKLPSRRAEGVTNIYLKVSGRYIKNPDILLWMPSEESWKKFVDPEISRISVNKSGNPMTIPQQYIALVYEGNSVANPDLIKPVENSRPKFNWTEMPHPSNTKAGFMLIPVATEKTS